MVHANPIWSQAKRQWALESFRWKFTTVTLETIEAYDDLIVSAFIQGLKEGDLWSFPLEMAYDLGSSTQRPNTYGNEWLCKFPNKYGHNTDKCSHLKNEIKTLIRDNRLHKYVAYI